MPCKHHGQEHDRCDKGLAEHLSVACIIRRSGRASGASGAGASGASGGAGGGSAGTTATVSVPDNTSLLIGGELVRGTARLIAVRNLDRLEPEGPSRITRVAGALVHVAPRVIAPCFLLRNRLLSGRGFGQVEAVACAGLNMLLAAVTIICGVRTWDWGGSKKQSLVPGSTCFLQLSP